VNVGESFKVLLADPPWSFKDKLPGNGRGAVKHYSVMTINEICAFEIPMMADDSYLLMWRVSSQVEEAYRVVRAWGFVPKSEIVWCKVGANGNPRIGMGRHVRNAHESCIVAVRGRPQPKAKNVPSWFTAQRKEHSRKPDEFYSMIEAFIEGPYAELFARRTRPGWATFGDELAAP